MTRWFVMKGFYSSGLKISGKLLKKMADRNDYRTNRTQAAAAVLGSAGLAHMIIKTRYRDIPWEEAVKCYRLDSGGYPVDKVPHEQQIQNWDKKWRNKQIIIIAPALSEPQYKHVRCRGPFYQVADSRNIVCPHIAEIGD